MLKKNKDGTYQVILTEKDVQNLREATQPVFSFWEIGWRLWIVIILLLFLKLMDDLWLN